MKSIWKGRILSAAPVSHDFVACPNCGVVQDFKEDEIRECPVCDAAIAMERGELVLKAGINAASE